MTVSKIVLFIRIFLTHIYFILVIKSQLDDFVRALKNQKRILTSIKNKRIAFPFKIFTWTLNLNKRDEEWIRKRRWEFYILDFWVIKKQFLTFIIIILFLFYFIVSLLIWWMMQKFRMMVWVLRSCQNTNRQMLE